MAIAQSHRTSDKGCDAALWIVAKRPGAPPLEGPVAAIERAAIDLLVAHHANNIRVLSACCDFEGKFSPNRERLVLGLVERSSEHKAQGAARVALASYLLGKVQMADRLAIEVPTAKSDANPKPWDAYILQCDADATRAQAEKLLNEVAEHYADESFRFRRFKTLGELAEDLRDEMNNLRIGKAAPEIDGLDLDGRRLKLSDHRGKVVMLVFWATWCGPCMAAVPEERKIYDQFKDRRFVMLGVSADDDLEAARKVVADRGIP